MERENTVCRHDERHWQVSPYDGDVWCFACKPPRNLSEEYDAVLTEVADVAYYAAKVIHYAASVASVSVDTALRLAVAKYELRAQPGNPKNDYEERAACMAVYLAGSAADDLESLADRVEHIETRIATLAAQVARLAGAA